MERQCTSTYTHISKDNILFINDEGQKSRILKTKILTKSLMEMRDGLDIDG